YASYNSCCCFGYWWFYIYFFYTNLNKKSTKRDRKSFGNFYGFCFSSKYLHGCEKNIVPTGKTSESMGVMVAFTSAVASDYWGINFRKKVTDRLLWKPK